MKFDVDSYAITWFKDRYTEETLDIKPPYQRRPVWGLRQKAKLIESILLKLPIPELFIDESTTDEGETSFAIIDGQQRTRAVLQFLGLDRDPIDEEYNNFALETLGNDSPFRDKTFKDLTSAERKEFFSYKFSVRTLYNPSDIEVRDTFKRINEYLTKLNDQELRNATYSGRFVTLVGECADNPFWTENKLFKPSHIRRMKDLQYVSDLLIGVAYGPQSGSGRGIDEYYSLYEEYDDEIPEETDILSRYDYALKSIRKLFPDFTEAGRFKNLTDFYSLFVAVAAFRRAGKELSDSTKGLAKLRKALLAFSEGVDQRLSNPQKTAPKDIARYARAIEKGVSDKSRRSTRHEALLKLLEKYGN
jgi:hypothetical protein